MDNKEDDMLHNKFTKQADAVLKKAGEAAIRLGHNYIGTEHLLIGLIRTDGLASEVLRDNGVEEDEMIQLVEELIAPNSTIQIAESGDFTPRARKIISASHKEAEYMKAGKTGTEHILISHAVFPSGDVPRSPK